MFCSNCGKEIQQSSKFCPNCGSKIDLVQMEDESVCVQDVGKTETETETNPSQISQNDTETETNEVELNQGETEEIEMTQTELDYSEDAGNQETDNNSNNVEPEVITHEKTEVHTNVVLDSKGNSSAQAQPPKEYDTFLILSIVELVLCCLPAGIIALVMVNGAKNSWIAGDYEKSEKQIKNAKIALIAGVALTIVGTFLYFIAMFVFSI